MVTAGSFGQNSGDQGTHAKRAKAKEPGFGFFFWALHYAREAFSPLRGDRLGSQHWFWIRP